MTKDSHRFADARSKLGRVLRYAVAVAIALLVLGYVFLLVSGQLPERQRLDPTSIALLLFAAVIVTLTLAPGLLENIKSFEFGQLKVEIERVRDQQDKQRSELSFIKLVLPFLLPANDQRLLKSLLNKTAKQVPGSHTLRQQLRRLAGAKIVERLPGKSIGTEAADSVQVRLDSFLRLTDLGHEWVEQIETLEREETQ